MPTVVRFPFNCNANFNRLFQKSAKSNVNLFAFLRECKELAYQDNQSVAPLLQPGVVPLQSDRVQQVDVIKTDTSQWMYNNKEHTGQLILQLCVCVCVFFNVNLPIFTF